MKDVEPGSERDKILRVLKDLDESAGPKNVSRHAEKIGVDLDYDSIRGTMSDMVSEGLLDKPKRGLYTLCDDPHTDNAPKAPTVDGAHTDLTSLIESTVEMQIHTDARVAAGDGRVVHPTEATRNVEVPRGFLSEIIGFRPPQKIGIMRAEGDSMKPTIQDEELVIYEPLDDGITSSGVYVLHMMGGLRVKRVQPFSDGSFRLISDNDYDGYEDEVLIPSDSGDEFIREATGRVAEMYPVGRVLFPRRNTDEMHVKQVSAIIDRLVGGDVDTKALS